MRLVTLAAGFAAGYVLGTRAGREKYEQIAAAARKAAGSPAVSQAQNTAKALLGAGAGTADRRPRAAGVVASERAAAGGAASEHPVTGSAAEQPVAGAKPEALRDAEAPQRPVTYTGEPLS